MNVAAQVNVARGKWKAGAVNVAYGRGMVNGAIITVPVIYVAGGENSAYGRSMSKGEWCNNYRSDNYIARGDYSAYGKTGVGESGAIITVLVDIWQDRGKWKSIC